MSSESYFFLFLIFPSNSCQGWSLTETFFFETKIPKAIIPKCENKKKDKFHMDESDEILTRVNHFDSLHKSYQCMMLYHITDLEFELRIFP